MARSSSLLVFTLITASALQATTLSQSPRRHLTEEEETADGPLTENVPPYCSTPLQMETRRVPPPPPPVDDTDVDT
eukprot:CAMPEP_0172488972 /NCGR_PEP_ID=MMETSP1066-20121228/18709_1 /TAXON_ID=671091 /ORGANISM="Coscinodiscus wailesii, Strain CCMP2513" /LENGTH=75 /DNA_ID=CAMNT_0013256519 /DNA_START=30 /DNA_END=254 /DNA_ORIENTATION=+